MSTGPAPAVDRRQSATVQACRVRISQDTTVAAHSQAVLTWDTIDYAPSGMAPDGGGFSQVVIQETGLYEIQPLFNMGMISGFDVVYQVLLSDGAVRDIHRVHLDDMQWDVPFDYYLESGQRLQVMMDNQSGSVRIVEALANAHPSLSL
jgi:hypothetical protein